MVGIRPSTLDTLFELADFSVDYIATDEPQVDIIGEVRDADFERFEVSGASLHEAVERAHEVVAAILFTTRPAELQTGSATMIVAQPTSVAAGQAIEFALLIPVRVARG